MKRWHEPLLLGILTVFSTLILWLGLGMETIYRNFDGPYYIAVAKTWYDRETLGNQFSFDLPLEYYPAHLPFYPALISAAKKTGITHLQAMVGINLAAAAALAVSVYLIAKKYGWKNPFWIGFVTMFFWPRMWAVRSVGSPETLFILTVILSLFWFDQKKYWWSAVAGSAAILTKSPGILLIPTFVILGVRQILETKKIPWKMWPLKLTGLAVIGLFCFYYLKTGDFWAYFHTGDNIHLGWLPFRVFNSSQSWVGNFWLEDIIWVYLMGGLGVFAACRKNRTWGTFGAVFFLSLLFVSHRDISRYSLPLVPIAAAGFSDIWDKKETRWATVLILIPMFFYTLNFLSNNVMNIGDWAQLL